MEIEYLGVKFTSQERVEEALRQHVNNYKEIM